MNLLWPRRGRSPIPMEQRFWPKVDRSGGPDACWNWLASISRHGYGKIGSGGAGTGYSNAHRVAWELANGPIPHGLSVLHRCDNRPCVNPSHLFIGTHLDNMQDKIAKGRQIKGSASHLAKLTLAEVKTVRHLYFAERRTQYEIADFFGITQPAVSLICRHINWRLS